MADSPKEQLISWLNDAYAMEEQITKVLENHAKDAKDHPTLQARLQQHLEETRRHADLDKQMIQQLGGETSSLKSGISGMMGRMQGMTTALASDELVKDAISDYSTETFEIASYRALIAAAKQAQEPQIIEVCERIIQEEIAMANFLDRTLPMVVQEYMANQTNA